MADSEFFDSQFTVHQRDRSRATHAGGVIVVVNSDYISTREKSLEREDTESVWVKLNVANHCSLVESTLLMYSDVINLEAFDKHVDRVVAKA